MPDLDLKHAELAVQRYGRSPEALIPILQEIQDHYGHLPEAALQRVCETTDITPAAMAGVSTFYDMFRHEPAGRHRVRICCGTACHVTGAERVEDAFRRHLDIPAGQDTDAAGQFTLERVACLGCCTLAPVVRLDDSTYGHVSAEKTPQILREFEAEQAARAASGGSTESPCTGGNELVLHVGLGSCCMAKGSDRLFLALRESAQRAGAPVTIKRVGCVGMCHRTPLVEVAAAGQPRRFYEGLEAAQALELLHRHWKPGKLTRRVARFWTRLLDGLLLDTSGDAIEQRAIPAGDTGVSAFLSKQVHIATEHFGKLDPLSLEEYLAHDGFVALARCLDGGSPGQPAEQGKAQGQSPEQIIAAIESSGLRGRGGAGFPTGRKWRLVRQQPGEVKYVICNGDEGDPGAFMDRMLLESFPYRVIEGLAIAAVAVGAHEGFLYIRHEYPLAVQRVRAALADCERRGWLGERLLGRDYPLRLSIREGAGAFVCGEETALIASIEGRRGMPRLRPPFPAESGLRGKPTVINNVETLAQVPWILRRGPEAFAALGTASSKGTKVFALAGKIRRAGLIEIPMGTTLREIVEGIGGGVEEGRTFKAVQIGGPSGGCVPARLADTPVDFESLREVGAIMGSGGLVVLDDTACMVDLARYFLRFTQEQSCGKCTFCRIGTRRLLEILDRLCAGRGQADDLKTLESLSRQVSQGSLCGLGKTAPNPVLTTLRYFRDEFEAHLEGRCPAKKCVALIKYVVNDACTGCTLCAQHCPVDAIPMAPYAKHVINLDRCTRCDSCRKVCKYNAIEVV